MGISRYNLKKWFKMLTGKSTLHVNQGLGTIFSTKEIKGYYNDLTEKVLMDQEHIHDIEYLPVYEVESGEKVYFPIAIFQYGLACYDCYLNTGEEIYLKKFITCANWAEQNQNLNGSYNTFHFKYPNDPYSAMSQGEATSLLLRAFIETGEQKYKNSAKSAIDFMLLSLQEGGVTDYSNGGVCMLEYTNQPPVMNGWIFSLFGLYDAMLGFEDPKYSELFAKSIATLKESLSLYDNGYWTMYDNEKRIASPFYHNLHIAQMQALYMITGDEAFNSCGKKWGKYQKNPLNKARAFIKKALQKICE